MRHDIKILIAGGDMRQAHCAARLARRYGVTLAGFDGSALPADIRHLAGAPDTVGEFDFAVLPMRGLGSDGNITAPHFSAVLAAADVAAAVREGGTVFTGLADARLAELFPRHSLVSYMEREELLMKNAVLTAEGAVQLALERLDVALCGLPVLIVGLGRIGTSLAMILRGFGADVTAAVRSPKAAAKAVFADVADGVWYADSVAWACENGIVKGVNATTFLPDDNITREQMATILCRYAEYAGIKLSEDVPAVTFTDSAQISDYAAPSVAALQRAGIISGAQNADGSYSYYPAAFATREQACKVLSLI